MNDALNLIYYILNKFLDFMFTAYIFDGVSLGMLFIVLTIFSILIKYFLAIPQINLPKVEHDYLDVGGTHSNDYDKPIRSTSGD